MIPPLSTEDNLVRMIALAVFTLGIASASAQTPIEQKCASGKCTCSYLASTCRSFNTKGGYDVSRCDGYRQSCLQSGRWDDAKRHIDTVVKR
jgi:hypothetical protein